MATAVFPVRVSIHLRNGFLGGEWESDGYSTPLESQPVQDISALTARELGNFIFSSDLANEVVRLLSIGIVSLQLSLDELTSQVNWEGVETSKHGLGFIGLHPGIRLSRITGHATEFYPVCRVPRVPIIHADPCTRSYGHLVGSESEVQSIEAELKGTCSVSVINRAALSDVERALVSDHFDVIHFVGHTEVSPPSLVLHGDSEGKACLLELPELLSLVSLCQTRLLILNGCGSAQLPGVLGRALGRIGIDFVGNCRAIGDISAQLFGKVLLSSLCARFSFEDAMFHGRMAISATDDWSSPILYSERPSEVLFALPASLAGNLPPAQRVFLGRKRESEEVARLLPKGVVTLKGSGGIGKTTLACEIGRENSWKYPNGVWFVDLAPLDAGAGIFEAIALTFGITTLGTESIEERVFEFLRTQKLLLILDNCENVVSNCRSAVNVLQASCPHIAIICTSREQLHAANEHAIELPSLSYPSFLEDEEYSFTPSAAILDFEAVRLFILRAQSADSTFILSDDNVEDVCRIVSILDGIPLAIEMAAARVNMLTPRDMLARLTKTFDLLNLGLAGKTARQATIDATVRWSFDQLSTIEQSVFARLSVFAGSFSLEAAEEVLSFGHLDRNKIMSAIAHLRDKSLIVSLESYGFMRLGLLEVNRDFAKKICRASHEESELDSRLAKYLLELAQHVTEDMVANQDIWSRTLSVERINILKSIEVSLARPELADVAVGLASAFLHKWYFSGENKQAFRILSKVFQAVTTLDPERKFFLLANLIALAPTHEAKESYMNTARALEADSEDMYMRYIQPTICDVLWQEGKTDFAILEVERMWEYWSKVNLPLRLGFLPARLSILFVLQGNLDAARRWNSVFVSCRNEKVDPIGFAIGQIIEGILNDWTTSSDALKIRAGLQFLSSHEVKSWLQLCLMLCSTAVLSAHPEEAAQIYGYADTLGNYDSLSGPDVLNMLEEQRLRIQQALGTDYQRWHDVGITLQFDKILDLVLTSSSN